jgi:hypothetical protein
MPYALYNFPQMMYCGDWGQYPPMAPNKVMVREFPQFISGGFSYTDQNYQLRDKESNNLRERDIDRKPISQEIPEPPAFKSSLSQINPRTPTPTAPPEPIAKQESKPSCDAEKEQPSVEFKCEEHLYDNSSSHCSSSHKDSEESFHIDTQQVPPKPNKD